MSRLLRVARPASRRDRTRSRGQSLVELAIAVPIVMLLLLGMLEFGFAFSHHLTLEYATREGARTGAALANGTTEVACTGTSNVDAYIIAAVQRVLTSPGAGVPVGRVSQIRIYKATATGGEAGPVNVWVPGTGPTVDGSALLFNRSGPTGWDPCGRNNTAVNTDSVGVSLVYGYQYITPLGNIMGMVTPTTLTISDRTVMALNPS